MAVKNGEDSRGATAVAELARNREAVLGVAFSKLTLSSKQNFVLSHTGDYDRAQLPCRGVSRETRTLVER